MDTDKQNSSTYDRSWRLSLGSAICTGAGVFNTTDEDILNGAISFDAF